MKNIIIIVLGSVLVFYSVSYFLFSNTSFKYEDSKNQKTIANDNSPQSKYDKKQTKAEIKGTKPSLDNQVESSEEESEITEKDLDYERLKTQDAKSLQVYIKQKIDRAVIAEIGDKIPPLSGEAIMKLRNMGLLHSPSARAARIDLTPDLRSPALKLKDGKLLQRYTLKEFKDDKIVIEVYEGASRALKTYKLEDLDESCLYFFSDEAWAKKREAELKTLDPDYEKRKKLSEKIIPEVEKSVYTASGFAYSKVTKQWVPLKKKQVKYTITKDTEIFKNLMTEANAGDVFKGLGIEAYSEGKDVVFTGSVGINQNKLKNENALTVRLYRANEKDDKYRLIFNDKIKTQKVLNDLFLRIALKDENALSEKKNSVYYSLDIYDGNNLIQSLDPIKVILVQTPIITKDQWSYEPFFKEDEGFDVHIVENIVGTPINTYFTKLGNQKTEHNFSKLDKYNLKLTVSYKAMKWEKNNQIKEYVRSTNHKLSEGNEKLENYIIPDFENEDPHLNFNLKGLNAEITGLKLDGKEYPYFLSDKIFFRYPRGINATVDLLVKKSSKDPAGEPVTLNFKMPIRPPLVSVKTGFDGVEMKWAPIDEKQVNEDYIFPPKLDVIKGSWGINAGLNLKDISYIHKKDSFGSIEEYKLAFVNGIFKTQCWIENTGTLDVYLDLKPVINYSTPNHFSISLCKNETYLENAKNENLIKEVLGPRPVRVGLRSNMVHDKTGILDMQLSSAIVNGLIKEKDIELYDRNKDKETKIQNRVLNNKASNTQTLKAPVDFILSLNDFSREDGNGIEVWLIKNRITNGTYRTNNYLPTYRIGTLYWGKENSTGSRDKIISDLVAKIRELTEFKTSEVEFDENLPENLIFSKMSPVEQRSEQTQAAYIGESIMLSISNKIKERNILTFDEWNLVFQERQAMAAQGIEAEKKCKDDDVLVSGYAYNGSKNLEFFFFVSDLKTSRILGSARFEGATAAVSAELVKWLSTVKSFKKTADIPESILYAYNNTESNIKIENYAKTYTITHESSSAIDSIKVAEKEWEKGNRDFAINILQEAWAKKKTSGIGRLLATYFHETGLYSMELTVLQSVAEVSPGNNEVMKAITRAQSLIKNAKRNYNRIAKKANNREENLFKVERSGRTYRITTNSMFNEQFPVARRTYAQDWSSGGIETRIYYCMIPAKDLGQIYTDQSLNKYGVIGEVKEVTSKLPPNNGNDFTKAEKALAAVVTWEPYSVFDSPISNEMNKGLYLLYALNYLQSIYEETINGNSDSYLFKVTKSYFQSQLLTFTPEPMVKILFDLKDRPEMKVKIPLEKETKVFSAKDILRIISNGAIKNKKIDGWIRLDSYLAADLLASLGDASAAAFVSKVMTYPAIEEYKGKRADGGRKIDIDCIFFQAYKGHKEAINFLSEPKNYYFNMPEDKINFIILMAKAGREEILVNLLKDDKIEFMRWGKKDFMSKLLLEHPGKFGDKKIYYFLLMGLRDAAAVKSVFYSRIPHEENNRSNFLVQFYGKPYWEIYEDYMNEFKK